jgi:hypothetical protein
MNISHCDRCGQDTEPTGPDYDPSRLPRGRDYQLARPLRLTGAEPYSLTVDFCIPCGETFLNDFCAWRWEELQRHGGITDA